MDAETLRQLGRRNKRTKARWDEANAALVAAIWEAADEGVLKQSEIAAAVGLTRERLRVICGEDYRAKYKARQAFLAE
jgi:hypothetical protein